MKRHIPVILDTLAIVALAVWLGGLAVCWLVLAPSLYSAPTEAAHAVQTVFAETLRRFSAITETCGIVLAALQWVLRRRYQRVQSLFVTDGFRMVAMFIALFFAEYCRYGLIPALIKAPGPSIYSVLEALAVLQAIALVAYGALTIHLLSSRLSPVAVVAAPAGSVPAVPRRAKKQSR